MRKVAILGCGPAGLLAAHACELLRIESVTVFALKQPSVISGAQFIHEEIPGLDLAPPDTVKYVKLGSKEGYAEKVYGDPLAPCSWDLLPEGSHKAWPMRGIYQTLWDLYGADVNDKRIYGHDLAPLEREYDLVINTIPRMLLCLRRHSFASVRVFFRERTGIGDNFIEYNGNGEFDYYRKSLLFGHESYEFGDRNGMHAKVYDREGVKPLSTSCNCHPKTLFVGRFGKWQKGVLVHHAFREVCSALQQL